MNVPRYAALAAKLLRQRFAPPPPASADRDRGVGTIERALGARTRRLRWRWLGVAGAAAAAAAGVLGWRELASSSVGVGQVSISASPLGQGAALRVGQKDVQLQDRATISPGQAIATPVGGGASVRLSNGSELALGSGSSVRVDSGGPTERFSLAQGRLSVHVAKLVSGQRFIIDTPDAQVEVRGTRFELKVLAVREACGGGKRTRLNVSEGLVEVRSAGAVARVSAGQSWPPDCAASPLVEPQPASVAAAAPLPRVSSEPAASPAPAVAASPPVSRAAVSVPLSRQNDLFAEAVSLRRRGDVSSALEAYQELISQFPKSPLAQNAMVERMRLLATAPGGRGRDEAKRYLARYPKGFAVQEARRLAETP